MRVFKFRAWDKIIGCWSDDRNSSLAKITIGLDGSILIEDDCATYRPEDYIIEQFTGLLDFDGKEIYEGDRITFGNGFTDVIWNDRAGMFCSVIGVPISDLFPKKIIGHVHMKDEF